MRFDLRRAASIVKMPFYAIRSGKTPGVYSTWDEAKTQIEGFKGAIHKKFKTQEDAEAFVQVKGGYSAPMVYPSSSSSSSSAASADGCAYWTYEAPALAEKPEKPMKKEKKPVIKPDPDSATFAAFEFQQPYRAPIPLSSTHELIAITVQRSSWGANVKPVVTYQPIMRGSHVDVQIKVSKPKYDLVMYTDGACKGNNNVAEKNCPAGSGVVALSKNNDVIDELFAPVELSRSSPFFQGATVKSNNTAELSAIGEALRYARDIAVGMSCSTCKSTCTCSRVPICIRYDSEYAAKSVTGEFNGEKNKALYQNIRGVFREVAKGGVYSEGGFKGQLRKGIDVVFEKVKGHSGDIWNDRADLLANKGASGLTCQAGRYQKPKSQVEPGPGSGPGSSAGSILDSLLESGSSSGPSSGAVGDASMSVGRARDSESEGEEEANPSKARRI